MHPSKYYGYHNQEITKQAYYAIKAARMLKAGALDSVEALKMVIDNGGTVALLNMAKQSWGYYLHQVTKAMIKQQKLDTY